MSVPLPVQDLRGAFRKNIPDRAMPKLSRVKLTKRTGDAAKAPAHGDAFTWDCEVRGFGLRVYASGRRLFLFQYQAPGTAQTRRVAAA